VYECTVLRTGQLNPEQFVRFVRDVTGITASKISDESLVRVFKYIDEQANGTIDEDTLKR
jgi:Ca2+-binding EF-hand superfamily protein